MDTPTILAAKAVEIYFFRIIRRKSGSSAKGDAALRTMIEKYTQLKNLSAYRSYSQFFEATEGIMDSLYDFETLQKDILSILFPIAQPMFEGLFTSSNSEKLDF